MRTSRSFSFLAAAAACGTNGMPADDTTGDDDTMPPPPDNGFRIQSPDIDVMPGEEVTAEVVVANRKAAHSFAPEVRDLYEIWVAFEAIDDQGTVLLRSGFLKPDAMLDESAHVYKAILLDHLNRLCFHNYRVLATHRAREKKCRYYLGSALHLQP